MSHEAAMLYAELSGFKLYPFINKRDENGHIDFGKNAKFTPCDNPSKGEIQCAELAIVEIPDGIEWEIDDYDGIETIAETHRTWS